MSKRIHDRHCSSSIKDRQSPSHHVQENQRNTCWCYSPELCQQAKHPEPCPFENCHLCPAYEMVQDVPTSPLNCAMNHTSFEQHGNGLHTNVDESMEPACHCSIWPGKHRYQLGQANEHHQSWIPPCQRNVNRIDGCTMCRYNDFRYLTVALRDRCTREDDGCWCAIGNTTSLGQLQSHCRWNSQCQVEHVCQVTNLQPSMCSPVRCCDECWSQGPVAIPRMPKNLNIRAPVRSGVCRRPSHWGKLR